MKNDHESENDLISKIEIDLIIDQPIPDIDLDVSIQPGIFPVTRRDDNETKKRLQEAMKKAAEAAEEAERARMIAMGAYYTAHHHHHHHHRHG